MRLLAAKPRSRLDLLRRAVALDPVNAQARAFLGGSLSVLGQQEEARAEYARVIELNPSAPFGHAGVGQTYLLQGKFEEAATAAQQDAADWARLLIVSCARWAQKRIPESDAALAELIAKFGETAAYQIAEVYGYRNDKDQRSNGWNARAGNATPVCPVCAQIRCYRIFTTTRAGMHFCARWAWPTTS